MVTIRVNFGLASVVRSAVCVYAERTHSYCGLDRFSYEIGDIAEMKFFKDKARGRNGSGPMTAERSEAACQRQSPKGATGGE